MPLIGGGPVPCIVCFVNVESLDALSIPSSRDSTGMGNPHPLVLHKQLDCHRSAPAC